MPLRFFEFTVVVEFEDFEGAVVIGVGVIKVIFANCDRADLTFIKIDFIRNFFIYKVPSSENIIFRATKK